MARRATKKAVSKPKAADVAAGLRKALVKRTKVELVDELLELARSDRAILRKLSARFEVEAEAGELVAATTRAISDATDFDEREMNSNFDYDFDSYETVKRNLTRLMGLGQIRTAMKLSLELMKQGSYQVEMSDEGLMTHVLEGCLDAVIRPLRSCDLPAKEIVTWCSAMLERDRVQFIARESLQALRKQFQASGE